MAHIEQWLSIFSYDFMRHAFIAGTLAAVLAGAVGYFVALRKLAFAGHALTHVGFAGAAGAALVGLTALTGQLIVSVLAALVIGTAGERIARNDLVVGIVLALSLGMGSLFLHLQAGYAGQINIILFGDLLSVSTEALYIMGLLTAISLLLLATIARPLLFASVEPEVAAARGIRLPWLATLFLILMAVAVTLASQVVGVLLVFTLLIGPAAIALQWTQTFGAGVLFSIVLAVCVVWLGIVCAYASD